MCVVTSLTLVINGDQILQQLFAVLTLEEACVPALIHMCCMTHSYVCHDAFLCMPRLIHHLDLSILGEHTGLRAVSHACHDTFLCVPELSHYLNIFILGEHTGSRGVSYACHDAFICVP